MPVTDHVNDGARSISYKNTKEEHHLEHGLQQQIFEATVSSCRKRQRWKLE